MEQMICKPEDPQVTRLLSTATYIDSSGYYTRNQVANFTSAYLDALQSGLEEDPLARLINTYGEDAVFGSVSNINNNYINQPWLQEIINSQNNDSDIISAEDYAGLYSTVVERIETGPFTPTEIAAFMVDQNLSPDGIDNLANNGGTDLLTQLNDWYTNTGPGGFKESFIGGLCRAAGTVFGAIGGFFSLLGAVGGLAQDITKFLNKIKNIEDPIKALFEKIKVKALIESIKEKITGMVTKVIDRVKNAIENFNLADIMKDVTTFVNENVMKGFHKLKEQALSFFSKENMDRIKQQLKDAFDYGVGLFANPNIQEIQFLIARFCGLAGAVEDAVSALKSPLDSWANRFAYSFQRIQAAGNLNTARAIQNGGRQVLAPQARNEQINNLRERWLAAGNKRPITDEDYKALPNFEQLEKGDHPSMLYFDRRLTTWPRYDGADGWKNANMDLRVVLMRVAQSFGERLHINSAWRSTEHNNRVGGSSGSYHLSGNAFDISWKGYPNRRDEFLEIAYREGFTGHGIYGSFTHVDLGNRVFIP